MSETEEQDETIYKAVNPTYSGPWSLKPNKDPKSKKGADDGHQQSEPDKKLLKTESPQNGVSKLDDANGKRGAT
jgi:hypothetical protein